MKKIENNTIRNQAKETWYHDNNNEINIDHDAAISRTEDGTGAWVQAWVYIRLDNPEAA